MPVIVVGADTEAGKAIADGLWSPPREVRVFVTDPDAGTAFKDRGFKVAIGDVSDESHVEGAALRCFTAVLVAYAAHDDRERAFASSAEAVISGWARAVESAGVTRAIWLTGSYHPPTAVAEVSRVDPSDKDFVDQVVAIDDAHWAG